VNMITALADLSAGLNGTFNIGNEAPEVKIGELADTVFSVVGKGNKGKAMPDTAGSPARRCPSMKKTREAVGIDGKVGLKEGISLTFDWYRKNVFESHGVSAK